MHTRPWLWYGIFFLLVCLALSGLVCHAQVIELDCPTGTLPISPFTTRNPSTGGIKRNACVDTLGNVSFQGAAAGQGQPLINVTNYGVKADAKRISDGSSTNTSQTVTCPNSALNPCVFTSADIGKTVFGIASGIVYVPKGTITAINSPQSIQVSSAATSTSAGGLTLVWGTDDTAALQAADTALQALDRCGTVVFPQGRMLTSQPLFNTQPAKCTLGPSYLGEAAGLNFIGQGRNSTYIIPMPGFAFANCPQYCFFSPITSIGVSIYKLTIDGVTQYLSGVTLTPAVGVTTLGTDSMAQDLYIVSWGRSAGSSFVGLNVSGQADYLLGVGVDDVGTIAMQISGTNVAAFASFAGDMPAGGATSLNVASGAIFYDYMGGYGPTTGGNDIQVNGGTLYGFGTYSQASSANKVTLRISNGGTANLYGTRLQNDVAPNATSYGIYFDTGGGTVSARDSIIKGGATNGMLNGVASAGTFLDQGGNTFSGPVSSYTGKIAGTGSITGVSQTSGNIALGGSWGTSPSVGTVSGFTKREQFTITVGSGSPGANPTVTVTYPTAFLTAPMCRLSQIGGTQTALALQFTTGTVTTTTAAFTYNGTPTASATIIAQMDCDSP